VHLTLPAEWTKRRLRVPKGVLVHFADVPKSERGAIGPLPMTDVFRTVLDCVDAHVSPELVEAALRQARKRSLLDKFQFGAIRARRKAA
jgi:hypothetical protein